MTIKKNCYNCKHIEWADGEDWGSSGYICNKVRPNWCVDKDDEQIGKMESEQYLLRSKVCFEPEDKKDAC